MKLEDAERILAEASQGTSILATLDTKRAGRYKDGPGYRVRLEHKRARRVLTIEQSRQWESVLQAWEGL